MPEAKSEKADSGQPWWAMRTGQVGSTCGRDRTKSRPGTEHEFKSCQDYPLKTNEGKCLFCDCSRTREKMNYANGTLEELNCTDSGTERHELTSWKSFPSIFKFFSEAVKAKNSLVKPTPTRRSNRIKYEEF
ncbi:hypothetical protein DUI87_04871 [Hirundo rustica rustica]|uniref:Uncharacterized protein n=1 Tax=Hirundo rustica rustica TaxID=333673 RepID=A0A3M0KXV7_HIRRU|nr:hypothetical protein DUI87_04871 [Hirundo rustica rustica]